jgi:hypothetical protein
MALTSRGISQMVSKAWQQRVDAWRHDMFSGDVNSVSSQVYALATHAIEFRAMVDSVRAKELPMLGAVYQMAVDDFIAIHAVMIRKLVETNLDHHGNEKPKKKHVFSLLSVCEDIAKHQHLLTREHLAAVRGYPLDAEAFAVRRRDAVLALGPGTHGVAGPSDDQVFYFHRWMDRLAGIAQKARRPSDAIDPKHIDAMVRNLSVHAGPFRIISNKFFAHAATPESRADESIQPLLKPTWKQCWNCTMYLLQCASWICNHVLDRGGHDWVIVNPELDWVGTHDRSVHSSASRAFEHRYQQLAEKWRLRYQVRGDWPRTLK